MIDMLTVETAPVCDAVVIWMHGLGADGSDFPPTIPYLRLPEDLKIRFLFPNAPERPVTINGGWVMRSWYDILSMDNNGREISRDELRSSVDSISAIIQAQTAAGIAPERILLVGFSQGGAVAYETGLTYPQRIGGIAAMSTYLPRHLDEVAPSAVKDLPIIALHGTMDDVVSLSMGESAVEQLSKVGYQPQWKTFPMGHEVSIESLNTLGRWMSERLHH